MKEVGIEYDFPQDTIELWSHLVGIPLVRQIEILYPDKHADFHNEVANRYREIYDTKAIAICPPFPGLNSMLDALTEAKVLISIASSKRRPLIETVLNHLDLGRYFQLVVGANDVTNHKPHPESVHFTLGKLGIDLADSVVIGDSTYDLDMARNAGVDAIGVTTGIHTKEHLERSEPAHIVASLEEVTPIILGSAPKVLH